MDYTWKVTLDGESVGRRWTKADAERYARLVRAELRRQKMPVRGRVQIVPLGANRPVLIRLSYTEPAPADLHDHI